MKLEGKTPPHGNVRVMEGGKETMKNISADLKRSRESAVVVLENESSGSRGYISFREGSITEAFFRRTAGGMETETASGREALIRVWKEALDSKARVKVYSMLREEEVEGQSEMQLIDQWRREGYEVDKWARNMKKGREGRKSLEELKRRIERLREIERELEQAGSAYPEEEKRKLLSMVRNPDRVGEVELGVALLRKRSSGKRMKSGEEYDEILDLVLRSSSETPRCPQCGARMSGGICQNCGVKAPEADSLNPYMKFSNFVTGNNNRFPHAAALSVATGEGRQYNPLYIYSANGLGKTHLLNAVGNYLTENRRGKAIYIGAENLAQSETLPKTDGFDCILLDDIHLLAGNAALQSQILAMVEAALKSGRKVVVAGSEEPSKLHLDQHLASRLEGGLVVDIRPPEEETRMKILEMKCTELGYHVSEDVLHFIASRIEDNVRELIGALVKLMAYSSLMKTGPSVELATKVLRQDEKKADTSAMELRPGHGYLIEEDRASLCHMLAQSLAEDGWKVLDITRVNPTRLKIKYPGLDRARVIWLTDRENAGVDRLEPSLEKIEFEIMSFIEKNSARDRGVVVNIDDIQYVISNTNFEGTVRLLRRVVDDVSERNSILLISVGRETLSKQEIAVLERELELIQ